MKKIPIDVSSFSVLMKNQYVYVDKTEHIYRLITKGRFYFLARPRRFGKSLLVSTLAEIFSGNRELFKGLWIYEKSDYDWQPHPVIQLDFSKFNCETAQKLEISLSWAIEQIAKGYGLDVSTAPFPGEKLQLLVETVAKQSQVVILIDEYDYPLISNLLKLEAAHEHREVLRQFYNTIKGLDKYLKALFLTGVSKFAKASVFSGLNNLYDLTLNPTANTLLGYTKEEILRFFPEHLEQVAQALGKNSEDIMRMITHWYNGYRFSHEAQLMYNPFSVLYLLQNKVFDNYWFQSGTPTFLMQVFKKHQNELIDMEEVKMPAEAMGSFELDNLPLIPILYQTGYLTIKEYDTKNNLYKLGTPNLEVRESLNKYILASLAHAEATSVHSTLSFLMQALEQGDVDRFMSYLQVLFAHIPYQLHIPEERYYHSLFQLLVSILSPDTQSEVATDKGRIDLVMKANGRVFIFEIKLDGTPEQALEQIEERKYYQRYLLSENTVVLVGVAFNRQKERLNLLYKFETPNF